MCPDSVCTSVVALPPPCPGQLVRVRQRQYLVEDVTAGGALEASLVRLACVDDDAQGDELEVLWEKEVGRKLWMMLRGAFDALRNARGELDGHPR